ncbi:MAG: hypothetical protein IKO25_03800 [Clostridia bacterium]|nr:hypothetical protein [Clostridia bacterium]
MEIREWDEDWDDDGSTAEKRRREKEIYTARMCILREEQRQTFDALILPLEDLQLGEKTRKDWIAKARVLSGDIDWTAYDLTRMSFMMFASEVLQVLDLPYVQMNGIRQKMYTRFMEGRIRCFMDREKREKCPLPAVPAGEADLDNTEMAAVFARLAEEEDLSSFLEEMRIDWKYEQLHMVTWFASQLSLGEGIYCRTRPNHSARVTYERLLNPRSLLWIAAALGEDRDLLRDAFRVAAERRDCRDKAVILRNRIPFSRIYRLARPRTVAFFPFR